METIYNHSEKREMTISIKDLLMRICYKWRVIFVCAVIFAVVFNGIGIIKDYREIQNQKDVANENVSEEAQLANALKETEQIRKTLKEREIADVDRAVETYGNLNKQYRSNMEYYQNSIKMQLDSSKIPMTMVKYAVDTHYEVEYPTIAKKDYTSTIVDSLCSVVESDDAYNKLANALENPTDVNYMKELITVNKELNTFDVEIMAPTSKDSEALSKIIKDIIENAGTELQGEFGEFDLVLLSDDFGEVADNSLLNEQTQIIGNINNVRSAISNLMTGMNDGQKNYYTALLKYNSLVNGDFETLEKDEIEQDNFDKTGTVEWINIKMCLVGIIFGILVVCVWVCIKYIVTGCLRTDSDIEEVFELCNLGTLRKEKKGKIDKMVLGLFQRNDILSTEDQIRIICANIKIIAQKNDVKNVYITGSSYSEDAKRIYNIICEKLSNDFENVNCGMPIVYDPESLQKMSESDGIVLVEKIDSSRYINIKKEIDMCILNQIPIIGSVVIE